VREGFADGFCHRDFPRIVGVGVWEPRCGALHRLRLDEPYLPASGNLGTGIEGERCALGEPGQIAKDGFSLVFPGGFVSRLAGFDVGQGRNERGQDLLFAGRGVYGLEGALLEADEPEDGGWWSVFIAATAAGSRPAWP
jgi:hypothetical protein